jgi:hypothetical protein
VRGCLISDIQVHPQNARQGDIGAICESMAHNGFFSACVVHCRTAGAFVSEWSATASFISHRPRLAKRSAQFNNPHHLSHLGIYRRQPRYWCTVATVAL